MKIRLLLPLVLLLAGAVQAQDSIPDYRYGMHLDVRKVLEITEPKTDLCQVVKATMIYLNSAGQEQAVRYRKLSERCTYES